MYVKSYVDFLMVILDMTSSDPDQKSYMGFLMVTSDFTLSDPKKSKVRSQYF